MKQISVFFVLLTVCSLSWSESKKARAFFDFYLGMTLSSAIERLGNSSCRKHYYLSGPSYQCRYDLDGSGSYKKNINDLTYGAIANMRLDFDENKRLYEMTFCSDHVHSHAKADSDQQLSGYRKKQQTLLDAVVDQFNSGEYKQELEKDYINRSVKAYCLIFTDQAIKQQVRQF